MTQIPDSGFITAAAEESAASREADSKTAKGKAYYDQRRRELDLGHRELDHDDHSREVKDREKYTDRLFWLMVVWMSVVLAILVVTGVQDSFFVLSDTVLVALIGGTTANVIGLFVIVARHLFPHRNKTQ